MVTKLLKILEVKPRMRVQQFLKNLLTFKMEPENE